MSRTSIPFRQIVPPTKRKRNFLPVLRLSAGPSGLNTVVATPNGTSQTFSGETPLATKLSKTCRDGIHTSSTWRLIGSTHAGGILPYSQGWMITNFFARGGRVKSGGQPCRMYTSQGSEFFAPISDWSRRATCGAQTPACCSGSTGSRRRRKSRLPAMRLHSSRFTSARLLR